MKKALFRSFSKTINFFYLILSILFIVFTASVFYIAATNQLTETTIDTMQNIVTQKNEFISYVYRDIFEQFYTFIQQNSVTKLANGQALTPGDYIQLTEEMDELYGSNSYLVDSIYINLHDFQLVYNEERGIRNNIDIELDDFSSYEHNEGYFWVGNHTSPLLDSERDVQAIGHLVSDFYGNEVGVVLIYLNTFFIENVLDDFSLEEGYMLLMSGQSYYTTEDSNVYDGLNQQIHAQYLEGVGTQEVQEISTESLGSYYVQQSPVNFNDWALALVTPKPTIFNSESTLSWVIIIFSLFIALLAFLLLRMIKRYISNPIEELSEKMLGTETFDEKIEKPETVPDELAVLYESFNKLIERNTELFTEVTLSQEERMELEVALLHSQISPHFLYNTLSAIKGLSDMEMNEEASQMTTQLSDFFRTSLSRGREIIQLEEELQNVESYLTIMETRYGDFFDYTINIPKKWYPYYIVKLSLQPLIENAIYHGVMNDRKKGLISLTCKEEDGDIVFSVWDNGKGIKEEKLSKIREELSAPYLTDSETETGVGLRSVHIRIKNRYGEKYGLVIDSEYGEYTQILLRIPKIKGE
ncbi:sensor histidine kinase [Alkalibacterium iburiense]